MNRHRALAYCLSMIPLVKPDGVLFGNPLHSFPDQALAMGDIMGLTKLPN
jgi:hypothetical protein